MSDKRKKYSDNPEINALERAALREIGEDPDGPNEEHSDIPDRKRGQRGRSAETTRLIEAAQEILAEMAPMTVRGICYQLFNQKLIPSMGRLDTQRVSRVLTDARERGEIDWDLIVDRGRQLQRVAAWENPEGLIESATLQYRKDFWSWQPYRIIVISEKATLQGVVDPVTRKWGVDFLAVGGFNSATRMHDLAEEIEFDDRHTIILYVGDWDPSGLYMSEVDFPSRLEDYDAPDDMYTFTRVALTESDIGSGLPTFTAEEKRTDSRYQWFVERYGNVCIEVDALNPNELRERAEAAITRYVEPVAWERTQTAEAAERESIKDILAKMRKKKRA